MFHVVFVTCSLILTIGFAVWAFGNYRAGGLATDLVYGVGGSIASVGLIIYGRIFLKKLKDISYL
jgi:hypothetical protein